MDEPRRNEEDEIMQNCNGNRRKTKREDRALRSATEAREHSQPISSLGGARQPAGANASRPIRKQHVTAAELPAGHQPMREQISHGRKWVSAPANQKAAKQRRGEIRGCNGGWAKRWKSLCWPSNWERRGRSDQLTVPWDQLSSLNDQQQDTTKCNWTRKVFKK